MRIAVQIGHVNGKAGAAYEEETLKLVFPHVVQRLKDSGQSVTTFDGSLQNEDGRWQYDFDVAVFLHCDSYAVTNSGYSIGYWEEEHPGSEKLARVMKDVYGTASGLGFVGYNITVGEHHYYGNRRFSHRTKCVLIELGFVSNPAERKFLQANSQRLAYAVADSISLYLGRPAEKTPSKEEDGMLYEGDGKKFVFEDCYVARYNYFLHTRGESKEITFTLTSHETQIPKTSDGQDLHGHKVHNLQDVAAYSKTLTKGSYVLECDSDSSIHWAMREVPK